MRELCCARRGFGRRCGRVVAGLGFEMARRGEFVEAMELSPIYIRKPEAEEKWEKARGST